MTSKHQEQRQLSDNPVESRVWKDPDVSKVLQKQCSSSSCNTCCCFQWLKRNCHKKESITRPSKKISTLKVPKDIPKGHKVVYVGENVRWFVVKISLLKQPLFRALLDQSRDEYDDSTTPLKLWIPCDEAMFLDVVRCASSPTEHWHQWRLGVFCI